ncbi:hypothetical protein IWQ60_009629 [Tieghemiomyces parasiticus]|uniref:Cytochrome c oxidase subunit 8, mitochondrial n=1 Tax=Tieghemiomyces parasiticus TaxID=78921 RepID=A0A9W7ZSM3_9FUNG|nr:hypothetical protein IWQ60_009629 [Tieghemiomyces parasiticus]
MSAFAARSLISRGAFARRQLLRSDHHHWNNENNAHLPFDINNKTKLAFKMTAFTVTGFGLPFFLAWWSLRNSA